MLSITAEHALRALSEMASLDDGESILGRDLAQVAGIPANYLSKLLLVLGNAGIIDATRGSGGGYRLRRKATDLRLREVVDLFDHQKPERRCLLGGTKDCSEGDECDAHEEWHRVRASYVEFLGKTTLAQITHRRRVNVILIGAPESPT